MAFAFVSMAPTALRNTSKAPQSTSQPTRFSTRSTFLARTARLSRQAPRRHPTPRMASGGASEQGGETTAKELAQLYGGSYLGTSIGLSIVSYIVLYFMVAAGVDVRGLINAFGDWLSTTPVGRPSVLDSVSDTASTATLAYIAHKATSPLRFPLTVAATPVVARAFSKKESNEAGGDSS